MEKTGHKNRQKNQQKKNGEKDAPVLLLVRSSSADPRHGTLEATMLYRSLHAESGAVDCITPLGTRRCSIQLPTQVHLWAQACTLYYRSYVARSCCWDEDRYVSDRRTHWLGGTRPAEGRTVITAYDTSIQPTEHLELT